MSDSELTQQQVTKLINDSELTEPQIQQVIEAINTTHHLVEKGRTDGLSIAARELIKPGHLVSLLGLVVALAAIAGSGAALAVDQLQTDATVQLAKEQIRARQDEFFKRLKNGDMDLICRSLSVVDSFGEQAVSLESKPEGGLINIYAARFGAVAGFRVYSEDGKPKGWVVAHKTRQFGGQ